MKAWNSTIEIKTCRCGCGRMKKLGLNGYATLKCMPPEMREQPKYKTKATMAKANRANLGVLSRKVVSAQKEEISQGEAKNRVKLELWFNCRRLEMVNACCECGKGTNRNNPKYFKWSICHIVPKSLVRSVATHEHNWIELCQLHHQEYDNSFDRAAKMMCFGEIKMKFQLFKHLIPNDELRKINPHLLSD